MYSSDGVYLFDMGSSEYKFSMNQSVGNFALDNYFTLVHKTFKSVIKLIVCVYYSISMVNMTRGAFHIS